MKLLAGKTALVTGATRGIGRAIALRFASEGADVAFTYRSQHEAAQALVEELQTLGVKAKAYSSDAASFEDAHAVVEDVKTVFGRIDILVNNAGIQGQSYRSVQVYRQGDGRSRFLCEEEVHRKMWQELQYSLLAIFHPMSQDKSSTAAAA